MPKIIKDIDKKILIAATELFETRGYENTDMKRIAEKSGTAVGNLYRYYSSKSVLFMTVMRTTLFQELEKLYVLTESDQCAEDKLKRFTRSLYKIMIQKRGMFEEFIKANSHDRICDIAPNVDDKSTVQKKLVDSIEEFILNVNKASNIKFPKNMERRFAITIFGIAWTLDMEYPDNQDDNFKFIDYIIDSIYNDSISLAEKDEHKKL